MRGGRLESLADLCGIAQFSHEALKLGNRYESTGANLDAAEAAARDELESGRPTDAEPPSGLRHTDKKRFRVRHAFS